MPGGGRRVREHRRSSGLRSRVEYVLTSLGEMLQAPLSELVEWASVYTAQFQPLRENDTEGDLQRFFPKIARISARPLRGMVSAAVHWPTAPPVAAQTRV